MDLKGMQTKLDQQMKGAKNKERLREKLAKRQEAEKRPTETVTEEKFTVGEGAERSSPGDKKKKKKGKK